MKKIESIIKYFAIILFLFSVAQQLKAKNPEEIIITANSAVSPDDSGESSGYPITIYGHIVITTDPETGLFIIDCPPPYDVVCFVLIVHPPDDQGGTNNNTVILNDGNQTKITVTSDPVITTDENGTNIYTFTR